MDPIGLTNINFYFLGTRDYVNGLSIFEEMLKTYLQTCSKDVSHIAKIKTFKINKFITNNSWIEFYNSAGIERNPKIKRASARIDLLTENGRISILLFEKNDPVKTRLKEYDRGQYLTNVSHYPDDSTLAEISNCNDIFEVTRGIVEANFRFVNQKARTLGKQVRSSWAYLTDFDISRFKNFNSHKITARFELNRHYAAYDKFFVIRTLQIRNFQKEAFSEICFFF